MITTSSPLRACSINSLSFRRVSDTDAVIITLL
jgi:hypothetical protein